MCEPTTILSLASLAAAGTGSALQYSASRKQKKALDVQQAQEQRRQGDVMRQQMRLHEQQRQDALEARKKFQSGTLDAFTREGVDKDAAAAQTSLSAALQSAGERATAAPGSSAADSTQATGAVSVSDGRTPAASGENAAHRAALRQALDRAGRVNQQAAGAQGALLALGRAHQMGGERLAEAANQIDLTNARLVALNRPRAALGGVAEASRSMFGARAEEAANEGAGTALAGQALGALGNLGYSYASRGAWRRTPAAQTAPVT